MKIVLDSNVVISALIFPGSSPDKIVREILKGRFINGISPDIITEVLRILEKKFRVPTQRHEEIKDMIVGAFKMVYPKMRIDRIKEDPTDNRILECAVEFDAESIITGDKRHLLPIREYKGIELISPGEFRIKYGLI